MASNREELATIVLFLRFLNMYHDFVFITVLRNEWAKFLTKVKEVSIFGIVQGSRTLLRLFRAGQYA